MQALIFDISHGWETSSGFEKAEVPEPVINEKNNPADANAVIIKVHYAGVCGSDRGIWHRQAFRDQILGSIAASRCRNCDSLNARPSADVANARQHKSTGTDVPQVPCIQHRATSAAGYRIIGHEFFGEVIAVGSKVARTKIGDFVTCESHVVCNACFQCQRGEYHVCTNEKILGISHDGGFAEYAKVPEHIVWVTDTGKIRPEIATMQEPFGNAVHAASKVDLGGKTIALFGLGPIGMMLSLVIRGLGAAAIIGIDPNPIAREMAKRLGIDYVIPLGAISKEKPYAHDQTITDEIMRITNGVGADV
ncbi:MAG: alcohol dehydrogenase catalytic domain-containing protein, partial [Candidatus Sungiibacteriota bacterium]